MIAESAHNKEHLFYFDWTEQCKYCEQSNQCLYKKQFYEYCTFIKNIDEYQEEYTNSTDGAGCPCLHGTDGQLH